MTEQNQPPVNDQPDDSFEEFVDNFIEDPEAENAAAQNAVQNGGPATLVEPLQAPPPQSLPPQAPPQGVSESAPPAPVGTNNRLASDAPTGDEARMGQRLERLGGEPAPVITPEEFARLQKAGQVHIDERGRVRTARRESEVNAGVSLRKRRAWYA